MEHVQHTFDPIFNEESEILILGTFPSVKSREADFYYSHPQNRFWKLISTITNCEDYSTIDKKKKMLLDNKIAIWDTIASCDILGSSDASITNVVPIDLISLLEKTNIKKIYTNGTKLYELYPLKAKYPILNVVGWGCKPAEGV
ncbi:MAG: DNA-deoxyinosine glycosylase [Bacilli bacterium]